MPLELSELLRALAFPGSDALFVLSCAILAWYLFRIRAGILFWVFLSLFVGIPLIYSITSGRAELAIIAFSIITFFTLLQTSQTLVPLWVRVALFSAFVSISYFIPIGEPIYSGSTFNSLFDSGNAFVYYLLLTACIIAFVVRKVPVSVVLAAPLVLIQTKSAVILAISSRAMFLMTLALLYPLYLYITSLDRISWFIEKYGVIYALGSGRLERFAQRANSTFTPEMLLFGSPYPRRLENFEIEFIDFVYDFGLFYSFAFFTACGFILWKTTKGHFVKLAVVFVLLNLSGHFWNNPLLIVTFVTLTHYVSNYNNDNVSR